jgi:hypothetical protein
MKARAVVATFGIKFERRPTLSAIADITIPLRLRFRSGSIGLCPLALSVHSRRTFLLFRSCGAFLTRRACLKLETTSRFGAGQIADRIGKVAFCSRIFVNYCFP